MAQAFLVNFPFLFWFNNLNHLRMIFPKTCEIEETVRNDKKSWDSRQNREGWQVWCRDVICQLSRDVIGYEDSLSVIGAFQSV